ncbi:MAG: DTW domain-containing protein, partial [Bacteriovoracaceae bacterium]|nr:DTW domain-containing protein [Bacteriovoracaceae bacterium]
GTWPCAKKMMKLSRNINSLPRICFTPTVKSRFDVKFQPDEMCLSTIESIHFFLSEWERMGHAVYDSAHDGLIYIFDKMVEFQKGCALNPELPSYRKGRYKEHHEKKKSKKWDSRKLFFD